MPKSCLPGECHCQKVALCFICVCHANTSFHASFSRVVIAACGIGAFFLARQYVDYNRQKGMLARQRINWTLEQELQQYRKEHLEEKRRLKKRKAEEENTLKEQPLKE